MTLIRRMLSRFSEDLLLTALVAGLIVLLLALPEHWGAIPGLIHWQTLFALAGLLVLSRGLEDSGYLARGGHWLVARLHSERAVALCLVWMAAALSAVVTNDVALFITVPLTLSLARQVSLPVGRLVIFQALAVNAGSALSPIGNPQNLFLWQTSGAGFVEFTLAMAPLALALMVVLTVATLAGFSGRTLSVHTQPDSARTDRPLFWVALGLYPAFLVVTELGYPGPLAALIIVGCVFFRRQVLRGVDWWLLVIFLLMFIDLGLVARLPLVREAMQHLDLLPGGVYSAGILTSQVISNVPAAILLNDFTHDWVALAWGVSVGGFGLAIGSLANLIALRLARQPGLWLWFHLWSVPALVLAWIIGAVLLF